MGGDAAGGGRRGGGFGGSGDGGGGAEGECDTPWRMHILGSTSTSRKRRSSRGGSVSAARPGPRFHAGETSRSRLCYLNLASPSSRCVARLHSRFVSCAGESQAGRGMLPQLLSSRNTGRSEEDEAHLDYGSMIVVVYNTVLSGAMARMLAEEALPPSGSMASA